MKWQRFTLDEIKARLNKMDNNMSASMDINILNDHLKQFVILSLHECKGRFPRLPAEQTFCGAAWKPPLQEV